MVSGTAFVSYIQFLGAAGTVTGSKHLVNTGGNSAGNRGFQILVDCGLFQGPKQWRERNWQDLPVPVRAIDAVVLTHAHLDHSGWIPRLVKQGFRGPIYATPATRDLCSILLPDSGHLQEEDAAFYNKHKKSKHAPALPLYTFEQAQACLEYFQPLPSDTSKQLSPALSFRFARAAHILGSAMVELALKSNGASRRLLFTGDIGRVRNQEVAPGKVVRLGPVEGETADLLVMESTYGNRQHPTEDPRPQLAAVIRETVERGGSVVVPAFAVERTQKFLFILKELMESGKIGQVPVYCDSPMAIQAVEIFMKHSEEYSEETRRLVTQYGSPLTWPGFQFASTVEESKHISQSKDPSIIVSSSGMATGGRILHHLAQKLPEKKNTVVFIGFQAQGTRGFTIKNGASEVKIFGDVVPIRAQVVVFEQFSDHADTPELLEWLQTFKGRPGRTFLVHGDPEASSELCDVMSQKLGWKVQVARWMEKVEV
jgi:metallo-beta-lactamase family protein